MVSAVQGPACRHDPRTRRQGKGRRRALRARLQARRFGMLRVADAYARWLSRNKDDAAATAVYEAFDKKLPRHPLVQEGLRETKAGKKLPPLVDSPQAGAAEALYGIGATLTRRGGEDLALVYLQLALYLAAQPSAGAAVARRSLRIGEEAADGDQGLRARAGEFAAEAQRADPARDRSRRRRPQRRGDQDPQGRHRRGSQGSRSHHGARQYRARPQEVRRLRRDLLAGHRRRCRTPTTRTTGSTTTIAASARSAPSSGARPKPT